MKQLAPGVWRLHKFPTAATHCYLAGDVLIDTGRRILAEFFRELFDLEFGRPAIAFRAGPRPEIANTSLRRRLAIRS